MVLSCFVLDFIIGYFLKNTLASLENLDLVEFFVNWQIWHFCHSCTKLTLRGFKISKKKIAFTGYWTHNTNPTIRIPAAITTQPPRHLLNRISLNWTWIISGSIEHDFIRVWKSETGMDWQIGWVGKAAGILIVGLVMSILYKNARNVRSVNLGKTGVAFYSSPKMQNVKFYCRMSHGKVCVSLGVSVLPEVEVEISSWS